MQFVRNVHLIKQDECTVHRLEDINIDSFIQDLDPDVWKAICLLTQPLSSNAKRGTEFSNHLRKVRRCFCLCVLFFSINSQCSFPMHTLITDAIETCGGSSRLQKLLNRLGACASIDTHSRYVQYRVQKRMEEGPMASYPSCSFMIISADNLDFKHSFARVYSSKHEQSTWHGTTVQVVQPQPHKLTDVIAQPSAENLSKRLHSSLTPYTSPAKPSSFRSPVPKKQRRMRTGTESKTMATADQPLTMTGHIANLQKPNFKLSDFLSSSTDEQSNVELRTIINQYMLLKIACTDKGKTIIDIQSYLTLCTPRAT